MRSSWSVRRWPDRERRLHGWCDSIRPPFAGIWFVASAIRRRLTIWPKRFSCRAYQNLATFRSAGSLRGWLIGIARNMAIQHVRTEVRRRRKERGPLSARLSQWRIEQLAQDPGDGEDQERTFEALQACIEQLAPESRRVVDEHYFQRRTMESIAQRQGRGAGAVRMMLLRIRQALGECIRNKLRNPR